MANPAGNVIDSYLIKLGFATDTLGLARFNNVLGASGKSVLSTGAGLAGVFAGIAVAAAEYADKMRKVYSTSALAKTSVSSYQAFGKAVKAVGLDSEEGQRALDSLSEATINPGLRNYAELLKGSTWDAKDMAKNILGIVASLDAQVKSGAMYEAQAINNAAAVGISANVYRHLALGLDTVTGLHTKYSAEIRKSGVDTKEAEEATRKYNEQLTTAGVQWDSFVKKVMGGAILPAFSATFDAAGNIIEDFIARWKNGMSWDNLLPNLSSLGAWTSKVSKSLWKSFGDAHADDKAPTSTPSALAPSNGTTTSTAGGADKQAYMAKMEKQYGLPAGFLDKIWAAESGRGRNMVSSAGAKGDFQFMDTTAKEFGVDVNSFDSGANGAARKMAGLMKRYKGDQDKAHAAYNWGEGNLEKHFARGGTMANLPKETMGYVEKTRIGGEGNGAANGVTINQTVTNNITGSSDPKETAKIVGSTMESQHQNAARNLTNIMATN
jgi:hypothetical protein